MRHFLLKRSSGRKTLKSFPWPTYSMCQFLLKRLVGLIFVIFGASFLTFIMGYFAPGDPITAKTGNKFGLTIQLQLKHRYGLDLPWWQQYYHFLTNIVRGSFGPSFHYPNSTAWEVLQRGLPTSIELGLEVLVVSLIVGIPLGILSALRANT